MTESQIRETTEQYYFNVFNRLPVVLERGEGTRVWDVDGNEYIDFLAGIAVNSLGHCPPQVVRAVREQTERLMHVSNIYYNRPQSQLVEKMAKLFGLEKIFLCNSGAEAVEGAVKLARKYAAANGKQKGKILTMGNAFHGRTIATISMGMKKYQEGFNPILGGFGEVPFNDIEALEKAIDDQTAGVILEVIQGSGLQVASQEYMNALSSLCKKYNALLIVDEVQTGIARTGKWFSYQNYGVEADIVSSAKALGNGFPIGAVLARKEIAGAMTPGMHGSTFGGNPVACAAALATLEVLEKKNMAGQAAEKGAYFTRKLQELATETESINSIRGLGLMIGVELSFSCSGIVSDMLKRGILTNCTAGNVLRILPPLTITREEIDLYVEKLAESIKEVAADMEA